MENKILKKSIAFLLLLSMNMNSFAANLELDPNSRYNTKLDMSRNGTPIVNISTPNGRGISINEFLDYNVGHEGQVLNNADNIGRSHLAGIINANPNLAANQAANQAANLIILQVNGSNRSDIEGYLEALSRQKVNVILSNENGIYLNGAGTINIRNFVPTTGRVKLQNGDFVGIDVEKGRVVIGSNGFDASTTDYVNVIAKALELQGSLVGNKVDVTLGENTVDKNGAVTSKHGINSVAIDASKLGSMYAGQISIISTDKGAGVNSRGIVYSRDKKLEITADGKINVAKIKGNGIEINGTEYNQAELASSDKGININAKNIRLNGETQAAGDINLNGNTQNSSKIYSEGNFNTGSLLNTGDINVVGNFKADDFKNVLAAVNTGGNLNVKNLENSGSIQVSRSTGIDGKLNNSGNLTSIGKITVKNDILNSGNISTNGDLSSKNAVSSGIIVANNFTTSNLQNDGKIFTNADLKTKYFKNTGEISAVGKISSDSMVSSGSIRTNEALDISGDLNNDGTLQSAKDITVSSNIKNSGKIYAGGNLSGKDAVSSGKIVSKNLRVNDLKNDGEIFTNEDLQAKNVTNTGKIASAGNISTKDLKTSGSIKSNRKVTVSGKLENDGDLEAVEDIKVSGNVRNTKEIATNGDFSGKNVVSKGKIISKNFESEDLDNDGKISSNENVKARNIKNTGEIQAVGSISGNDLKTSGKVRANRKITVSGELENGGDLESGKSLTVSKNIRNTGKIAVNEDISGKDTQNSGSMYSKNLKTDNLKNDGKVEVGNDLKTADIENTKDITAVGKISGSNVNNSGKILTNGTLDVKNVKNIGKIAAGSDVTSQRLENSGVLATNGNITTSDSMINGGNIEGKNLDITGLEFTNSGKISADNIRARVNDTKNNGNISSANDIDLTTNTLTNTKEMLAANDINSNNATVSNSGKMASNGKILLNNSSITNIGEILSGEVSMQNAKKFDNTGTIKGNKTVLTTDQDLNLVGNLHGESLLEISGNNITNNGNTTGAGLIKISSNDFTNNKELASNAVIIDGRGNVVNNNMITGNDGKINGNSITNNDLIAFDNYLEMNAKSKVLNNKDKSIYGGNALIIKGSEILNDEGEILGGNMDLNASKITNNVGTIQSTGDIFVTSNDFQNIGRVSNLGSYEKYYETWDNRILTENEVKTLWIDSDKDRETVTKNKDKRWIGFRARYIDKLKNRQNTSSKIPSLLLSQDENTLKQLTQTHTKIQTGTPEIPQKALKGKIKSNATTEYGKMIASGNIIINSGDVKNKDSLISGGGLVNINATNFENSVTLGNAVKLKDGVEKINYEKWKVKHGIQWKLRAYYNRDLVDGGIGYESGQPSIIEGAVVNVNAPNIIKNSIEAGNGKVLNNGGATGKAILTPVLLGVNKGTSSNNGQVGISANGAVDKFNSIFNGNSKVNGNGNNSFDRAIQISGNNSVIQNIKKTGTIDVNPLLSSAMFTMNMSPSSKYLLETRSKYISLGQYYGSDYFTSRVGYSEIWDRSKRLGDAFYENQLLTRALNEKLGTSFLNGKSNQELIQSMMDNAADEKARLGLVVGQALTQDQINALNEDIIWYVSKEVNGISVLTPQIYLSSRTRESISDDTRNRIGGINGTYVKTKDFVNDGTKWGNGGVTYVEANTVRNETTTNLLSEITGDRTYINSVGNIENIGGSINGQDLVSVVSQNGDVVNKTTTREIGYNNGEFDRSRYTEVASIGEISSNGNTYIEGKNYTSTGAVTSGNTVKINASENININALKLTGEQKFGRDEDNYGSYGFVNHLKSFVNGTDGVMMTSGKDTNISGSQVASFGNVNINAQNINITNVVNSESMESKHVNSGFLSTERKAKNSYVEDNQGSQIFGNNVLLNSKKDTNVIASDVMANKDKFGNGGNILVTAGNNVNILSDTTSQSSSSMTSKSKSIGSLNIGNKGRADGMAQIIQNSSHLSANGGNIVVKSGKDTLIGASELQSTESIGLVAGGNVVVTGLDEKYGESSSKYKGGMFRGGHLYKSNSESEMNQNITNKESVLKAGKDIVVKGENIGIIGSDFDAGKDINVDAKNGIIVKSRNEVYSSENQKNESKVGFFAKGHNLSFEAGIEAKSKSDASATKQIKPDESTLVANGNINLKSGENIYFEGDAASGQDINFDSKNIFIADSEGKIEYMNKSKESRVSVGVDMNFNNLSDTFTSIGRMYFKAGALEYLKNPKKKVLAHNFGYMKSILHLSDLTSFAGDLLSGKSLLESLDGREDTINGINSYFAGPKEGSGRAGVYAKASMNASENRGSNGTIERTSLTAGGSVNLKGDNSVTIRGTDIKGFNDVNIETKNLDIKASKSSMNSKNASFGLSGEYSVFDKTFSLSGNISRGKTEGYTYNNTTIDAGNKLHINIENGAIKGANISGNDVAVNVKGNLEIASLQDYEKTDQRDVGGTVGSARTYSGQLGVTSGTKNWIGEQTSIVGRNSIRVDVGNKLTLTGAKISNEENGIDKGNLVVRAKEIEARDIEGHDDLMSVNVEGSLARRDIEHNQKNGKKAHEKYENDGAVTVEGHEREQIARATIGNGTIEGNVFGGIHRDIKTSSEITKGVEVKPVRVEYNDERSDWGSTNKILAQNAGTFGKFLDNVNEFKGWNLVDNVVGKPITNAVNTFLPEKGKITLTNSYESTFKNTTYDAVRSVEDFIDKNGNGTVGLIPTSGMHGGFIEQIPKFVIEDEQKVYKLVLTIKNGEPSYELKEVSRLDSEELLKKGEKVKVFNNGMNETLEKAVMNTAKQYAYGHGDGVYEMALIYNPTRGFVADALETGLGKVFDGKNAPSLGVSRGFETALRTNDPHQSYELRSYSQGNIILKGALNNMARKDDIKMPNFKLSHMASPIMDKTFAKGSYLQSHLGYTNIGSIGNLYDGVTSEKTGMFFGKATAGLASEMIDVSNDFDKERKALLNGTKGHYIHEFTKKIPGLGEAMGNIEQTAQVKAPLFLLETINAKNGTDARMKGYVYIENEDIKDIYRKQYPNDTKTVDVNKMRKILNKEFSRHRIYFDGDFGYKNQLDELEHWKNVALGVREEDKKEGREIYRYLIEKQKEINIQRQNNVIDILKTQRIPRADYDKDLVEQRNNVLKEELKNIDPRNPSLERSGTEIQNLERKNNIFPTNRNINDTIQKLRERVGN